MKTCLQDLSTELLIHIFEYCDIRDLYELQQTCSRFYGIIKNAPNLGNTNPLLVTNQLRQELRNRCDEWLTIREKCGISGNWRNGVYRERCLLKEKRRYIPWLVLTKDHVWLSKGNYIHAYKRHKRSIDVQRACYSVGLPNTADVCKFVVKQNCVISGHQDGSIHIWKSEKGIVNTSSCHNSDVHSVDFENCILVSGSKDRTMKIWTINTETEQHRAPIYSSDMGDRVWATAISRGCQYVAVGTAGHNSVPPLHICDLNRYTTLHKLGRNFHKGSGILHIKWESPFILLSCGYDKCVRKWDIRSGACEQSWEDPFNSTVYCFDTDNYCTMLTGTQSYGRVVLWDMRTRHYAQVYFMATTKGVFSSPVYSLSFDVFQLFTATDRFLNILDFSVNTGITRNYNNIFGTVR